MSCPGAEGRGASASRSETGSGSRKFPRSLRLTRRRQFATVYENGRRAGSSSFTLFALPNDVGHCRLGITATRKVGCAAERNRIKRVLRDIFRRRRGELAPGLDLVVNAKRGADEVPAARMESEFLARFEDLARRFRT